MPHSPGFAIIPMSTMICINWGVGRNHRVDKGITFVITRKVSPPEPLAPVGDPFFCERFSENGKRMMESRHSDIVFSMVETKKAPVHRGFLGTGIVPTGELEGREDETTDELPARVIVPTGELGDGLSDSRHSRRRQS